MAIIDPDGMFCGERLANCSDMAQLYWPRLFLASNGFARIELTYRSIVSKVFGNFKKVPESSEIWAVFREYEANFLAILYESPDGAWWCQFDTSEKYLPKYKKTRDITSPSPNSEKLESHRVGYLAWKKSKSLQNQSFQKVSEDFGSEGKGIGVGVGTGVIKKTTPKAAPSSVAVPEWISDRTWDAFEEMRKRIRKPLTDRARELTFAKLDRWRKEGQDPEAILNRSIEGSWTGLYPIDNPASGASLPACPVRTEETARQEEIEGYEMWLGMNDAFRKANPRTPPEGYEVRA